MIPAEAIIAAGGLVLAALVAAVTALVTASQATKAHEKKQDTDFMAAREQLLWEKAEMIWNARAEDLENRLKLEQTARESAHAAALAKIAVIEDDNARLKISHSRCEEEVKRLTTRLIRAGEQLRVDNGK